MSGSPDLSVIVPAYNARGTIERCLDSLVAQGTDGFSVEVVVVDDGSTDGMVDVLASYAEAHPEVAFLTVSNGGPSKARNIGLALATGRWVGFCDSDDWVDPGCFRPVTELAERRGADIAVFGYKNVRAGSTRTHARRVARVVGTTELAKRCLLDPRVQGFSWNKLYLRELVVRERFTEDVRFCEDLLFNIDVCRRNVGASVLLAPGAPYNYDLTREGLTRGGNTDRSLRDLFAGICSDSELEPAAKGAVYSRAVKAAYASRASLGAETKGYAAPFYLSEACPPSEKAAVAIRRTVVGLRSMLQRVSSR